MKKVGMITCYADNYGACLQAYALQRSIIKLGNECEIIKYTPINSMKERKGLFRLLTPFLNFLRLIKNRNTIDKYQGHMRRKFKQFKKDYLKFGNEPFPTIESLFNSPPDYDAFVTGSDQLWNPIIHGMKNNRAHYLDFAPAGRRRIAYAPSIGVSKIPESCKKEMKTLVERMDVVSVREKAGKDIINDISDKECRVVLDPTLLLDKKEWMDIVNLYPFQRPYIFCYLFGEQGYVDRFIKYARETTGYEIVVIPYTKREMQKGYVIKNDAGPREFLGLIKNASLVITDSFHATAFSINFNVPFYTLLRNTDDQVNNMNSRIFNILEMFNLKDRLIEPNSDYSNELELSIDFSEVNAVLNMRRKEDIEFLRDSIQG